MMTATAFAPQVATDLFDLANNENPLGPSPAVIEAISNAAAQVHRYPDNSGLPLREALANHYQLNPNQLLLGNGSNELIDLIARQWATPGSEVIIPSPSFLPYGSCAMRTGAQIIRTGLLDWQFDLETVLEMISDKTALVILANPNNPTGMQLDQERFEQWLNAIPEHILVVLDEAYAEFTDGKTQGPRLLPQRENLLILRTFSKAYGLAGLRIGYAMGQSEVIAKLQSQCQQFHVNRIAQAAALAALGDQEHLKHIVQNNRICRQKLSVGLGDSGIGHLPSSTNFILLHCGRSRETTEALQAYGLMVKPLERFGLPECIRVSIGLPDTIERLLSALRDIQHKHAWFPVSKKTACAPPQPNFGDKLWRY